ncbi:transcriptional regulator, LacI family [Beutenbergia cavernae DSM 12333]|uniref:Transcriptional regulator, LacI family n=1 Tax=Beutenbergia cavernae (strain ATCC BAA-8 / DSM 12333 / CCUG 43141 / JCM 11478 / NBRC 16432 / NCIMB 13614 / HKI 0122) TaxID=471853 RepID=C5C201_BEUC1|nr:LacI family DNA-binding transcriptional regulator [Beutenbergia cavernae]ACQ81626.1 transcriptional regulator, LacI family [Beutenbergia cavernae DSM 12333]
MGTQKEIARRAGVSVSVVSAVINGTKHTRMSDETRARVEAVIEELGYVPNDAARALRRQRSGTIAVVVEKIENPIYRDMFHGIYDAAEARGWAVVLGDARWMRSGSHFLARLLGQGSIDGIILRSEGLVDDEVVAHLRARPTPVIMVEGRHGLDGRWLAIDDAAAGRVATQHLIDLGHRQIEFAGGERWVPTVERHRGYADAMRDAGLEPRDAIRTGYGSQAGTEALTQIIASRRRPTALVVNNVLSGLGLYAAAHDAGIAIPDDLSVVAIHDADIADDLRPPLATVRMPMAELGARAVEAIAAILEDQSTRFGLVDDPAPVLLPRASTAPPPSSPRPW